MLPKLPTKREWFPSLIAAFPEAYPSPHPVPRIANVAPAPRGIGAKQNRLKK